MLLVIPAGALSAEAGKEQGGVHSGGSGGDVRFQARGEGAEGKEYEASGSANPAEGRRQEGVRILCGWERLQDGKELQL